jgi:hypothetical protein
MSIVDVGGPDTNTIPHYYPPHPNHHPVINNIEFYYPSHKTFSNMNNKRYMVFYNKSGLYKAINSPSTRDAEVMRQLLIEKLETRRQLSKALDR